MSIQRQSLTPREEEVLDLIARGKSNTEIASALGVSFPTAKTHVSNILEKLGLETREEAARWWDAHGSSREPSVFARWRRVVAPLAGLGAVRAASGFAALLLAVALGVAAFLVFDSRDGADPATSDAIPSPTPDPADCTATDGLALEPAFCVAWEPPATAPAGYTIWLSYAPDLKRDQYVYSAPGDATSFTFPADIAPPRNVPFDECKLVDEVAVRITADGRALNDPTAMVMSRRFQLTCAQFNADQTVSAVLAPPDLGTDEDLLGLPVQTLTLGSPTSWGGAAIYVVNGNCCEGPLTSISRFNEVPGEGIVETKLTGEPRTADGALTGYAIAPGGDRIAVGICTQGYCGPLNAAGADARASIYLSEDGGLSWTALAAFDHAVDVLSFTSDGGIAFADWGTQAARKEEYFVLKDGQIGPGSPPAPFDDSPTTRRVILPSGDTFKRTDDGFELVHEATGERLPLPFRDGHLRLVSSNPAQPGYQAFVTASSAGRFPSTVGIYYDDGTPRSVFSLSGSGGLDLEVVAPLFNEGFLAKKIPLGGISRNEFVLLDPAAGSVQPLEGPFSTTSINWLGLLRHGPFFTVRTDDGTCLNVRETPATSAPSLGCYADDVLLGRAMEALTGADGQPWEAVFTPDGRRGYAAAAFLR
ncbi:MAG TPA: LuxR C-terminal-related transcriptional regulator [Tepidiformaceae bacterium]|nr:LuxR C-terminal-related transcriptional regulator [Tepidiformaceae bacterium]